MEMRNERLFFYSYFEENKKIIMRSNDSGYKIEISKNIFLFNLISDTLKGECLKAVRRTKQHLIVPYKKFQ
jgi:hypothetical protein